MMVWLMEHPEVQAFAREMSEFMSRKPGKMVRHLYNDLEPGPYIRGYKAPQDIAQVHVLDFYRQYWPNTKLIVGIRHPVRWFESLYNFRVQNLLQSKVLPHANKLIGGCVLGKFHTCTHKSDFALSLMNLGKQNYPQPRLATPLEFEITSRYNRYNRNVTEISYMPNPVFLFALDQLGDANSTRNLQFRQDVSSFLGLQELLPALPHAIPGKRRTQAEQIRRDKLKINICDDEFMPLRNDLMSFSVRNSMWIREVFINSPTVFVSSRDHFEEIMEGWMKDPCDEPTVAE